MCLRIWTGFKRNSFRETHLGENFGRTDKLALITRLSKLSVSGAFLLCLGVLMSRGPQVTTSRITNQTSAGFLNKNRQRKIIPKFYWQSAQSFSETPSGHAQNFPALRAMGRKVLGRDVRPDIRTDVRGTLYLERGQCISIVQTRVDIMEHFGHNMAAKKLKERTATTPSFSSFKLSSSATSRT